MPLSNYEVTGGFADILSHATRLARSPEGDDGEQFLDVDLPGDPSRVAHLARDVLTQVWDVDQSARLTFMGESVET